ncbi:HTH-type transcriptional regulator HdfR [Marinobacterium arenosum]|uniref:HTH-type transcriptional regulator HdfR n=1 Tax=Marinobacterium arenosum TaxID=2862496 RepID=UPI001C98DE4D|nr:HTH-type transcriptional regulator HdfR [Marinobacterium arenosum]MBY4677759.1 HTH-type transcriptional regulator HdfR [Marinobacterium arenosum]
MDTELLRTFLEVSKTRHFGHAAENLYLTQSAVSFRVRQLEELLGVKLFERHRHNNRLTPAGERLVPHATAILTAWQRARQEVGLGEGRKLQLALGATPNLWDALLQQSLSRIAGQLPAVTLRTEMNAVPQLTRALLERTLDLALMLDPPKAEELELHQVGSLVLELVASEAELTVDQLAKPGYVSVDWGTQFSVQQARLLDLSGGPVLHTGQSRIALEFLLEAGGAAFLPQSMVQPYRRAGRLFAVRDAPLVERQIHLVHRRDCEHRPAIESVLALLQQAPQPAPVATVKGGCQGGNS